MLTETSWPTSHEQEDHALYTPSPTPEQLHKAGAVITPILQRKAWLLRGYRARKQYG